MELVGDLNQVRFSRARLTEEQANLPLFKTRNAEEIFTSAPVVIEQLGGSFQDSVEAFGDYLLSGGVDPRVFASTISPTTLVYLEGFGHKPETTHWWNHYEPSMHLVDEKMLGGTISRFADLPRVGFKVDTPQLHYPQVSWDLLRKFGWVAQSMLFKCEYVPLGPNVHLVGVDLPVSAKNEAVLAQVRRTQHLSLPLLGLGSNVAQFTQRR